MNPPAAKMDVTPLSSQELVDWKLSVLLATNGCQMLANANTVARLLATIDALTSQQEAKPEVVGRDELEEIIASAQYQHEQPDTWSEAISFNSIFMQNLVQRYKMEASAVADAIVSAFRGRVIGD